MPGKRSELKEKLSAEILDAAFEEFAEKGYSGTTIQSIAEKAGVSVGVICKYFESKEGLLRTIMQRVTLETIYEGFKGTDPEEVFNRYLNCLKDMQLNNPKLFSFYHQIFRDSELNRKPDGFCVRYLSDEFKGSILEKAILLAQEESDLPKRNPLDMYLLLVYAVFGIMEYYKVLGLPAPENGYILNVVQFDPGEKNRRRFIEEKEQEIRGLSKDLQVLAHTINRLFPLSIFCNLTRNEYHMLSYDDFYTRKADYSGTYDDLITAGMSTIEDAEDRENFRKAFNRQALLDSYENGRDMVELTHSQTGDDGKIRIMRTGAWIERDENGDVVSISISRELSGYLKRLDEDKKTMDKFFGKTERVDDGK